MQRFRDEEIKNINKIFLELNYKSGIGVPLSRKLHKLFHVLYGLTNNNELQFKEFKIRFSQGEFYKVLKLSDKDIKNKIKKRRKYRRLDKQEVIKIKEFLDNGFPITYLSKEFGVGEAAIYNIKTNKSWKDVI